MDQPWRLHIHYWKQSKVKIYIHRPHSWTWKGKGHFSNAVWSFFLFVGFSSIPFMRMNSEAPKFIMDWSYPWCQYKQYIWQSFEWAWDSTKKEKKKKKWVWDRRIRSSMRPHGISCTSSAMIDGAARKGPNCKSNEEEYLACGPQKCLATLSHFWIFINERME